MTADLATRRQGDKATYRVTLPVAIGGKPYQFGDLVELEIEKAVEYGYALISAEEEDGGGNDEGYPSN